MILLNSDSSIISETLKLNQSSPITRLDKVDISFEDHSGGQFHLYATKNVSGQKEIKLSAKFPAWKEISKEKDLMEIVEKEFEGFYCKTADEGFDVTISCKIDELSNEKIEKFSQLKQKIISLPLTRIFKEFKTDNREIIKPFTISFGNKDFYSVVPGVNKDQIIILFGMNFVDQTDTILAKVFLQEFYDTRNNRMEDAPVVLYGKEPPKELSNLSKSSDNSSLNYLTLVLFPRHYATPQAQDHLLKTVPFLSDYIHYHLKCSKAYLHQRMRAKTGDFLKVLNRAKPENF